MNGVEQPATPAKPVWPKILLGCVIVVILGIVGIAVLFTIGTRKFANAVVENAKNPKLREDKAKRMLGASALPAGYYPISGTFELPLITHVELSDRAPDKGGMVVGFDKRGFIFTESIYTDSSKKLEKFFSGASDSEKMVDDVRSGTIAIGNQTIRYRAARGRVEDKQYEADGPMVLMWIDCPGVKRERDAIWFSADEAILQETSIRNFMGQFDLCRAK